MYEISYSNQKSISISVDEYIEAGITKLSKNSTKIFNRVLAFLNDSIEENTIVFTQEYLNSILKISDLKSTLYHYIKKEFTDLKLTKDFNNWYNIFDNVSIKENNLILVFNEYFLNSYKKSLSNRHVFVKIHFLDSIGDLYIQKIYLMCRVYSKNKHIIRYQDTNIDGEKTGDFFEMRDTKVCVDDNMSEICNEEHSSRYTKEDYNTFLSKIGSSHKDFKNYSSYEKYIKDAVKKINTEADIKIDFEIIRDIDNHGRKGNQKYIIFYIRNAILYVTSSGSAKVHKNNIYKEKSGHASQGYYVYDYDKKDDSWENI